MLQIFDISQNRFVGKVPSLGNHHQDPWWLNLEMNNLGSGSDDDFDFIKSLTNCSKLETFVVSSNNFGGHLSNSIGHLSNSIGNLSTQLHYLYVDGDQIYLAIPKALGNLINLIGLDLEENHFIGTIPSTFEKFQICSF